MAKTYRSRLARKEKKRIMRQSMMLFGLTIIFGLGLLFWGIPTLIRMAGLMGEIKSSGEPIQDQDTIAPYTPQVGIPFEATSSASINISGYSASGSKVYLINNGQEISTTSANDQSEFNFEDIRLSDGLNEFQVYAENFSGAKSETSRVVPIIFDNVDPVLEVSEPTNDQAFYGITNQTITVKGTINEDAQIFVNDRIAFANTENEFSQQVRLQNGDNMITIKAVDPAGNESVIERKVTFSE